MGNTVSAISRQLGAYREIKERVDDLERRIAILSEIREENRKLNQVKADRLRVERILKILDIESCKMRVEAKEEDLKEIGARISELEEKYNTLESDKKQKTDELIEVKAEFHASDYGVKKKEMEDMQTTVGLLEGNSRQWREILDGLKAWAEDEDISGYVSNPTLQCIDEILEGEASVSAFEKLKRGIENALEMIGEELAELKDSIRRTKKELNDKKEAEKEEDEKLEKGGVV